MAEMRTEKDSMGTIDVLADHYWGAQTERSLHTSRSAATPSCGDAT